MKPVDVKSSTYLNFNIENIEKDPKFKFGDNVRISKQKIFLQRVKFQNSVKKFL